MDNDSNKIVINTGGLQSISSIHKNFSEGLSDFNQKWKEGKTPLVEWDLRNIIPGKISITALAYFLAIAHRIVLFTKYKHPINIYWNSEILAFLYDIGFFAIADKYNLFDWPYEIGGFKLNTINPNSKLLVYEPLGSLPDYNIEENVAIWKREHREKICKDIEPKCSSLFTREEKQNIGKLIFEISRTCSEIATNSLLWGKSFPFIGFQRTYHNITISISDIGVGFKSSLLAKNKDFGLLSGDNLDIKAIFLGCLLNEKGFGLKRIISTIVELGGHISITSNSGEVQLGEVLWKKIIDTFEMGGIEKVIKELPQPIFHAEKVDKNEGFVRNWKNSIRGSRIDFNIPVSNNRF